MLALLLSDAGFSLYQALLIGLAFALLPGIAWRSTLGLGRAAEVRQAADGWWLVDARGQTRLVGMRHGLLGGNLISVVFDTEQGKRRALLLQDSVSDEGHWRLRRMLVAREVADQLRRGL